MLDLKKENKGKNSHIYKKNVIISICAEITSNKVQKIDLLRIIMRFFILIIGTTCLRVSDYVLDSRVRNICIYFYVQLKEAMLV